MQGHFPAYSGGYGFPMYAPYPSPVMYPANFQGTSFASHAGARPVSTSMSRLSSVGHVQNTAIEAKPTSQTSPPSLDRTIVNTSNGKAAIKIVPDRDQHQGKGLSQVQEAIASSKPAQQNIITTSTTPSNQSARSTPGLAAGTISKSAKSIALMNSPVNSQVRKSNSQRNADGGATVGQSESPITCKSTDENSTPPLVLGVRRSGELHGAPKMTQDSSFLNECIGGFQQRGQSAHQELVCDPLQEKERTNINPSERDHKDSDLDSDNINGSDDGVVPLRACQANGSTDQEGHFHVEIGKLIEKNTAFPQGRYRVIQLLGSGTYGKVLLCADQKYQNASVAVKVIRKHDQTTGSELYRAAAKNEIQILRDLGGKHGTVLMLREFEHNMHICMTFEVLGDNLHEAMKLCGGFNIDQVRNISHQMLNAITYVHSKNIIHTDLKPENILLRPTISKNQPMLIKIVDFGTAIYTDAWHPPIVGTMHYRAPEAVLQAGYSFPLDIWAIGCIISELHTGHKLFELVHADVHLALMEKCLGSIPHDLILAGWSGSNPQNRSLFHPSSNGSVHLAPARKDPYSQKAIQSIKPIERMIGDADLVDLLVRMLRHGPAERLTGSEALEHVFYEVHDDDAQGETDHHLLIDDDAQDESDDQLLKTIAGGAEETAAGGAPSPPTT